MAVQLLLIVTVHLLGLTVAGQEAYQMLPIYNHAHSLLPTISPVAVPVTTTELPSVASSIVEAETWLRAHVLAFFPSTNITIIVVGSEVLCNKKHSQLLPLVLPALKNLHHSLQRWGLDRQIGVSPVFSGGCMSSSPEPDLPLEQLLAFIHSSGGSYSINHPSLHSSPANVASLVAAHGDFKKKIGSFRSLPPINVLTHSLPKKRRLSSSDFELGPPYPARPTPLPPRHSSVGVPSRTSPTTSHGGAGPSPIGVITPPPEAFDFAPPVYVVPTNPPPEAMVSPPCVAVAAPPPARVGEEKGVWCVAKPSVPEETLQEAMDYACGEGGGDCDAIAPTGKCYLPNTMVSHASYAFNSYWQMNKHIGGTCNFDGTAMLITSDPSFHHCQFMLL